MGGFGKESCVITYVRKPGNTYDRHDMTIAVKLVLNQNTTNQPVTLSILRQFQSNDLRTTTMAMKLLSRYLWRKIAYEISCPQGNKSCFNSFPDKPWFFMCLQHKSFESAVGNGGIAFNEQFLLFQQFFLPLWRTSCHFYRIWNCRLQMLSVWKSLKFLFWKG